MTRRYTPVQALQLLLEYADYSCRPAIDRTERISHAIPGEVLTQRRQALEHLGPLPVPVGGLTLPQQLQRIAAVLDDEHPIYAEIIRKAMIALAEIEPIRFSTNVAEMTGAGVILNGHAEVPIKFTNHAVRCKDRGGDVGANGECLVCTAEAGEICRRIPEPPPADTDHSRGDR